MSDYLLYQQCRNSLHSVSLCATEVQPCFFFFQLYGRKHHLNWRITLIFEVLCVRIDRERVQTCFVDVRLSCVIWGVEACTSLLHNSAHQEGRNSKQ